MAANRPFLVADRISWQRAMHQFRRAFFERLECRRNFSLSAAEGVAILPHDAIDLPNSVSVEHAIFRMADEMEMPNVCEPHNGHCEPPDPPTPDETTDNDRPHPSEADPAEHGVVPQDVVSAGHGHPLTIAAGDRSTKSSHVANASDHQLMQLAGNPGVVNVGANHAHFSARRTVALAQMTVHGRVTHGAKKISLSITDSDRSVSDHPEPAESQSAPNAFSEPEDEVLDAIVDESDVTLIAAELGNQPVSLASIDAPKLMQEMNQTDELGPSAVVDESLGEMSTTSAIEAQYDDEEYGVDWQLTAAVAVAVASGCGACLIDGHLHRKQSPDRG